MSGATPVSHPADVAKSPIAIPLNSFEFMVSPSVFAVLHHERVRPPDSDGRVSAEISNSVWQNPHIQRLLLPPPDQAFDSSEISGRIRAISDDAKRYVEASDEMMRLLEGS